MDHGHVRDFNLRQKNIRQRTEYKKARRQEDKKTRRQDDKTTRRPEDKKTRRQKIVVRRQQTAADSRQKTKVGFGFEGSVQKILAIRRLQI